MPEGEITSQANSLYKIDHESSDFSGKFVVVMGLLENRSKH
mgnify:CR=1 FL=1